MKTIYIVQSDEEVQGAFDEEGSLLGFWWNNDADYRVEYLAPFMRRLGFDVQRSKNPDHIAQLEAAADI